METRYASTYYDFERNLQWTYGDKYYLQASTKAFYDMHGRNLEHSERIPQPNSKQLLDISKRAFQKGELDISEKFLGKAIQKQKIEDPASERHPEPYYNLAEVLLQKASKSNVDVPEKEKLLLQATVLYNFTINCLTKSTVESEFATNILKSLPQKILNVQDGIILAAGGDPSCCEFNSEGKKRALEELREEAKEELGLINAKYDTKTGSDEELQKVFVRQATDVRNLFRKIASKMKQLLAEIIQECIDVLGEPPEWDYEIVLLGSLAREEMTPYSDLEWAILTNSEEEECKIFFRNLTNLVHFQLINLGQTILPCMDIEVLRGDWFYDDVTPRGLSFDGFLPQACKTPLGNTLDFELIHNPVTMANFQTNYWHVKNPDLGDILLTVAPLHDDKQALLNEYKRNVQKILREPCDLDGCTHDVLSNIPTRGACRGRRTLSKDVERYGQTMLDNCKTDDGKLYDVKKDIYRLTDRVAAGLSKVFCVGTSSSFEILDELCEGNVIGSNAKDNLASAAAIALKLRLSTYLSAGKQEESIKGDSNGNESEVRNVATSAYNIPQEKELLHFFYVTTPLYELLRWFFTDEKNSSEIFVSSVFFDYSDIVKGHTHCRILNYAAASDCYKRALVADPGNIDLQLRLMRIEYMLKKSKDAVPSMKSKLEDLLQVMRENSNLDQVLTEDGGVLLESVNARCRQEFTDQLFEIYLLTSNFYQSLGDASNARVTLEQCQKIEYNLSDLQKLIIRLDLIKVSDNQLTHPEFAEIVAQLTAFIKDEGISVRGLVWLNELGEFLARHQKNSEAYRCLQRALTMGRTLFGSNLNFNVVFTLYWLGAVCVDLLMYEEGKFYFQQILTMLPSLKDQFFVVIIKEVYRQLANISTLTNNHEEAISYFEKTLNSSIKGTNANLMIDCLTYCTMASTWSKLSESGKALRSALDAKDRLTNISDMRQKASLTCTVSKTFMEIGEIDEAKHLLNQGLATEHEAAPKVKYLNTLGHLCAQQSLMEDSECYYKEALRILKLGNDCTLDILATLVDISKVLIKNKKSSEAAKCLVDASKYLSKMVDNNEKSDCLKKIAACWEELEDYYNARKCLEQAVKVCAVSVENRKAVPYEEFDLHVQLGNLVEKVRKRSSLNAEESSEMSENDERMKKAQRMHYDRAGVVLRDHLATGCFNSMTVRLFAILAYLYNSIDMLEEEKLLLQALKMCEDIYGPNATNELVASILSDLADVYLRKKDYENAGSFFFCSLEIEKKLHSSDPYHDHIEMQILLLQGLFLEYPQWQHLEITMQRFLIFLEQHNEEEAFRKSVNKANCFAKMAPLCFLSGDFIKAEKFNQIAIEIFTAVKQRGIPQNVVLDTASCDIMSMLSNIMSRHQDLSNFRGFLTICREMFHAFLGAEYGHGSLRSANASSSVSQTKSIIAASFLNEAVLGNRSVSENSPSTFGSAEAPSPSKIVELKTVSTVSQPHASTRVINEEDQLARDPTDAREISQNSDDGANGKDYTVLQTTRNNDDSRFSNAGKQDEVNTVCKNEEENVNVDQLQSRVADNVEQDAKLTLSKELKSDCENISSMADSVLYDCKQGDLGRALETINNSLPPLLTSFYEKLSLPNDAKQPRKERNSLAMIRSLDLASKFPPDSETAAKMSKLCGEFQLSMQSYRMAAISFNKAVCFHRSDDTVSELEHFVEYAESLIGLTKSHLLCNDVQAAWETCQEGVAILSSVQPRLATSRLLVELLYLAAKCSLLLSTHSTREQDLDEVVSFCQQALATSDGVDSCGDSNDLTEELSLEKGEFFALKCEIKLLMASTLVQQSNLEESQKVATEMKEYLQNIAVIFEMFSKETWPAGIDDFSKIQRRLFSCLGRSLVILNDAESALMNLSKSLATLFIPAPPGSILPVEEIVPLLDAITAAIATTSHDQAETFSPFKKTIEVCKRKFLEHNEKLKELWEFFATLGNHYVDCHRIKDAIIVYEAGLAVAECMESDGQNENRGQMLLYLANAHRLQHLEKGAPEEHRLAEKYYQLENSNDSESSSILKNVMYAQFLFDDGRLEEVTAMLKRATDVGDTLWSRSVICLYSKRVLFGRDIEWYIESNGELLTNMGNLAYSLLVRVYIQLGNKKKAVEAYDKLCNDGKDFPDSFSFTTSCLSYQLSVCAKHLVSLVEEPRKLSFDESDFPLTATKLAKLYYELGEYEMTLKLCAKANLSTGSTGPTAAKGTNFLDNLSLAHLQENALVMSGERRTCYLVFLKMLQQKENILDKSFYEQKAILSKFSFPEPFYVYRMLGWILEERNIDGRIACFGHCLDLNPACDIDQNLIGSLAELYQTKALTEGKEDKVAYQRWVDRARDCFQKLLDKNIRMLPFVEAAYGSFLHRTKCFDEAILHFEQVISGEIFEGIVFSEVDVPLSDVYLAREIQARGKVELPSKVGVYYQLVLVYSECGMLEKAQECVLHMEGHVKNFTSRSDYPTIQSFLAYAYKESGNKRKASEIFLEVLDKEPDNDPVKIALKECQMVEQTTKSSY